MIATVALLRHGGSHLIRPIVDQLGFQIIEPGNFGAPIDQAQGPVIVFLREPRDRMVATWRWWSKKPRKMASMENASATTDGQIAWLLTDAEFLSEMIRWARIWCRWKGSLVVRFENMIPGSGEAEIGRIAERLGLPADPDRDGLIYDAVWLKGRTYTGRHSDWHDYFGPQANKVWAQRGGPELLKLMSY